MVGWYNSTTAYPGTYPTSRTTSEGIGNIFGNIYFFSEIRKEVINGQSWGSENHTSEHQKKYTRDTSGNSEKSAEYIHVV